ncbi:hypothetical protein ACNKHL_00165 [Shigella flexneri]
MLCFTHPFMGFDVPAILGYYVTLDAGTAPFTPRLATARTTMRLVRNMACKPVTRLAGRHMSAGHYPTLDGVNVFKRTTSSLRCCRKKARCCTFRNAAQLSVLLASQNADYLPRDAAVVVSMD